jgi:hypothetical protein
MATVQAFFQFMDVLLYVEATIYQMDEENEQLTSKQARMEHHTFQGMVASKACGKYLVSAGDQPSS